MISLVIVLQVTIGYILFEDVSYKKSRVVSLALDVSSNLKIRPLKHLPHRTGPGAFSGQSHGSILVKYRNPNVKVPFLRVSHQYKWLN